MLRSFIFRLSSTASPLVSEVSKAIFDYPINRGIVALNGYLLVAEGIFHMRSVRTISRFLRVGNCCCRSEGMVFIILARIFPFTLYQIGYWDIFSVRGQIV